MICIELFQVCVPSPEVSVSPAGRVTLVPTTPALLWPTSVTTTWVESSNVRATDPGPRNQFVQVNIFFFCLSVIFLSGFYPISWPKPSSPNTLTHAPHQTIPDSSPKSPRLKPLLPSNPLPLGHGTAVASTCFFNDVSPSRDNKLQIGSLDPQINSNKLVFCRTNYRCASPRSVQIRPGALSN